MAIILVIKTMNHLMKRVPCFVLVILVLCLSGNRMTAQPLPDGFDWVYGCWENPRTGDCYIIGKDGIRENMTRRRVGRCFLKAYPALDVWGEPLKPYGFSSFGGERTISFDGPFACTSYLVIGCHIVQEPGDNGDEFVKRPAPPKEDRAGAGSRVLGRWELAGNEDFTLEISATTIKQTTPRGTEECSYSVSEEGYLITDSEVFVFEDGKLHRHYSDTDSYLIDTCRRPADSPRAAP